MNYFINYYLMILDQFEKWSVIPYTTYQKEQKRKFKNDPTKSQNWQYNAEDDYCIDHLGVRFSFYRYSRRTSTNCQRNWMSWQKY
ncbi:hypothetical protein [Limosilactobacillus agrestis]|uniref:hypothetical protein n=1 Tax=Limosilactobacillus agrestis TaxID=2759748 RepID=UPI001E29918C|nr:hypothetical protein [Limosilactobacillus agrestis]MCD7112884.1 hypothetical protein [Limosilactobacillus agrestis]